MARGEILYRIVYISASQYPNFLNSRDSSLSSELLPKLPGLVK